MSAPESLRSAGRPAIVALIVLTGLNLLNYVDRYVISALVTLLEKPFEEGGLHLNETRIGLVFSAFLIVYTLTAPFFGAMADRLPRLHLLAISVAVWSLVTASCGLAAGFISLLVLRALTGVGEAAYAAIAPAVLADHFKIGVRGRVMAIFNAAIPVGAALGFILGGLVGGWFGWRGAFLIVGLPGVLLAFIIYGLKDPPRGANDALSPAEGRSMRPPGFRASLAMLSRPRYAFASLGYAMQTAGFGALAVWAPKFLEAAHGLSREKASMGFGAVIVVTGLGGTLLGGFLADRLYQRTPRAHLLVAGATTFLAAPFIFMAGLVAGDAAVWACIVMGSLMLVMSVGPINSHLANLLGPKERGTGMALAILVLHLLGDVPSVPIIGTVAGASGWPAAMAVTAAFTAVGGVIWLLGALREPAQHGPGSRAPEVVG
ncbi:MAG: MFS transporter [Phycisphaeraceae bacterium]|nr:MFS transporter [Phycisphaeraceae bacterium]